MSEVSPQSGHLVGGSIHAKRCPLPHVDTGIAWPSQICLLMHQSLMLRIQCRYTSVYRAGWNVISPLSTAPMPGAASDAMRTHHCSLTSGSSTVPQRSQ